MTQAESSLFHFAKFVVERDASFAHSKHFSDLIKHHPYLAEKIPLPLMPSHEQFDAYITEQLVFLKGLEAEHNARIEAAAKLLNRMAASVSKINNEIKLLVK